MAYTNYGDDWGMVYDCYSHITGKLPSSSIQGIELEYDCDCSGCSSCTKAIQPEENYDGCPKTCGGWGWWKKSSSAQKKGGCELAFLTFELLERQRAKHRYGRHMKRHKTLYEWIGIVYVYIYIYAYIGREGEDGRERERYIYIYIHIHTHTEENHVVWESGDLFFLTWCCFSLPQTGKMGTGFI